MFLLAVLLIPPHLFAQSDSDYAALFKNLQKLQSELKQSERSAAACEIPHVAECAFGDYCQKLRSQSQNFYLYKNADGKTVPNFFFIRLAKQVEGCLGQPMPETDSQDPFVNPLKLKTSSAAYQTELKRTQKIFADVKTRTVALLQSRKNANNAQEIDQEIKRVQAVQMKSLMFNDQRELERECGLPNATYQPDSNSISICPQMLALPDATLLSLLSHEISHSVDPCNAHKNIAGTSVAAKKNPFAQVLSCLSQSSSMGAKSSSQADLLSKINKEEKKLAKDLGPLSLEVKAAFEKKRQTVKDNFDSYQYCRNFSGSADMQEGFADWMSSKIVAGKIAEIKDVAKAKEYAYETQLFIAGSECDNVKVAAINRVAAAVEKECPQFTEYKQMLLHPEQYTDPDIVPHPNSSRRVDKILFAPPEIQKALGCKGSSHTSVCE